MKRTPRCPITNKATTRAIKIKARLCQALPELLGSLVNAPLRRGGMIFSSMAPIIRQPTVDRQASVYQALGTD